MWDRPPCLRRICVAAPDVPYPFLQRTASPGMLVDQRLTLHQREPHNVYLRPRVVAWVSGEIHTLFVILGFSRIVKNHLLIRLIPTSRSERLPIPVANQAAVGSSRSRACDLELHALREVHPVSLLTWPLQGSNVAGRLDKTDDSRAFGTITRAGLHVFARHRFETAYRVSTYQTKYQRRRDPVYIDNVRGQRRNSSRTRRLPDRASGSSVFHRRSRLRPAAAAPVGEKRLIHPIQTADSPRGSVI
jgi:hypothetical protein